MWNDTGMVTITQWRATCQASSTLVNSWTWKSDDTHAFSDWNVQHKHWWCTQARPERSHVMYRNSRKKWYNTILSYLLNTCMNYTWLFAQEARYKEDILAFTCHVVQHYLKSTEYHHVIQVHIEYLLLKMHMWKRRNDNKGLDISNSIPESRRRCKQCKSQTVYVCNKCNIPLHFKSSLDYNKSTAWVWWVRNSFILLDFDFL